MKDWLGFQERVFQVHDTEGGSNCNQDHKITHEDKNSNGNFMGCIYLGLERSKVKGSEFSCISK